MLIYLIMAVVLYMFIVLLTINQSGSVYLHTKAITSNYT